MTVKLLTEQHFEFPSLKRSCTCSSDSTLVKMPHCWELHVAAQIILAKQKVSTSFKVSCSNEQPVPKECSPTVLNITLGVRGLSVNHYCPNRPIQCHICPFAGEILSGISTRT